MRFFALASATFAIVGMAAASPFAAADATFEPFYVRRACDCPGIIQCCQDCFGGGNVEHCCNVDCANKFPGCGNQC